MGAAIVLPANSITTRIVHAEEQKLPNVKILATGGTIARAAASSTQTTGYTERPRSTL